MGKEFIPNGELGYYFLTSKPLKGIQCDTEYLKVADGYTCLSLITQEDIDTVKSMDYMYEFMMYCSENCEIGSLNAELQLWLEMK